MTTTFSRIDHYNFAEETLSSGITSGSGTMTLNSVASFTQDGPFVFVIFNSTDYTSPGDDPDHEAMIGRITDRGTKTVTLDNRGVGGTTAADHNTGGKTYSVRLTPLASNLQHRWDPILFGADPEGVADSTNALNACFDKEGPVIWRDGTYLVTGTIGVHGDCALEGVPQLDFNGGTTEPAIEVRAKSGGASVLENITVELPNVTNLAGGSAKTNVGVKITNVSTGSRIRLHSIADFFVGYAFVNDGTNTGNCLIEVDGTISGHEVGARYYGAQAGDNPRTVRTEGGKWDPSHAASKAGTRTFEIGDDAEAGDAPFNLTFLGCAINSGNAPEFDVECFGGECEFVSLNWRSGAKVQFDGTDGDGINNRVVGGVNLVTVTEVSGADRNFIAYGDGIRSTEDLDLTGNDVVEIFTGSSAILGLGVDSSQRTYLGRSAAIGTHTFSCEADSKAAVAVNRTTDDGDLVTFQQDGTTEGAISVSGVTVTYGDFLGSHPTQLSPGQAVPPIGGVVISTGEVVPGGTTLWRVPIRRAVDEVRDGRKVPKRDPETGDVVREVVGHEVVQDEPGLAPEDDWERIDVPASDRFTRIASTTTPADPRVYGVYLGQTADDTYGRRFGVDTEALHSVGALGLTEILVVDSNGPIRAGDLLRSSATEWHAERQDDDIMRSSTVAKCLVDVVFAAGVARVPATIHCG